MDSSKNTKIYTAALLKIDRLIGKHYFKKIDRLLKEKQSVLEADQSYLIDCFEKIERLLRAGQ